MTHEETIKRIQELVPSVMELEFGGEVRSLKDVQGIGAIVLKGNVGNYVGNDNFLFQHAQMFGVSGAGFEWERGYKHQYVSLKNHENLKSEFEILGKPITLAVVMMAIDKKHEENLFATVASNGWLHFGSKRTFWDLFKDNLNDQSEETKKFIGHLLTN